LREIPLIERHLSREWEFSIHRTALRVLKRARDTKAAPSEVATEMADELSLQHHPIFGRRGRAIILDLVAGEWHLSRRDHPVP